MNVKQIVMSGVILSACCTSAAFANANVTSLSPEQKAQMGEVIREYLLKNPEVIKDSIIALQKKEMDEMLLKSKEAAIQEKGALFQGTPALGAKDPKAVLVMFSDYQCGHCRNVSPVLDKLREKNKDLKVIYKEFPIFGGNSILAAKAALAANKQGKFSEIHSGLMNLKSAPTQEAIEKIAKDNQLDLTKFKNDMTSKESDETLKENAILAQKLGLRGTPAFFMVPASDIELNTVTFIPGEASEKQLQDIIDGYKK